MLILQTAPYVTFLFLAESHKVSCTPNWALSIQRQKKTAVY